MSDDNDQKTLFPRYVILVKNGNKTSYYHRTAVGGEEWLVDDISQVTFMSKSTALKNAKNLAMGNGWGIRDLNYDSPLKFGDKILVCRAEIVELRLDQEDRFTVTSTNTMRARAIGAIEKNFSNLGIELNTENVKQG